MEQYNQKTINPHELDKISESQIEDVVHELAKIFESQIKSVVSEKFSILTDDLELLLEDEDGVYLSQEEPDTLCCFVVGKKNGFLYLVTGKMEAGGKSLTNFKSDIVC